MEIYKRIKDIIKAKPYLPEMVISIAIIIMLAIVLFI